ncbi:uncharacterized protein LOC108915539 [Anoplophora glabripennis]|uniref:uncharacterized protein LOC108915539 n=1 Tax=Anoplophora glabripennis TaxID=217634 RepID=UPI000C779A41|nr:uncharacterized protein LOC108915539 [Anoplophora glabripennis]
MDQKINSILRIAKYGFNKGYAIKQKIVLIIIDVGYRLFEFSENLSIYDMSHCLFFVAAKGDLRQLIEIVTHFKTSGNVTKIHDTREGDTILSFMAKFGDYIQEDFLNCFRFMLDQGVDIERTDYYKNNLKQIIAKEMKIFQEGEICEILKTMYNIVDTFAKPIAYNADSTLSHKYQLFQAIIHGSKNLIDVSEDYKHLVNSDDGENTLLQLAIIKNNVVIAKELLNMGANPNQIVKGRNEEVPLVLAGKLDRHNIFTEILKNKDIEISESTFVELVKKSKWKFTNPLLESKKLNVDFEHKGKIPLQYAIKAKNRKAVKSLLERGSCVNDTCLRNINPKDLEYYLNSCIHSDYQKDLEENSYKSFLVFDFFLNSSRKFHKKKNPHDNSNESGQLYNGSPGKFESEVAIIRNIGNMKRLKHLLEHPLVYIYIMLKWHCVWKYYYFFVILKSIFYLIINILLFTGSFNFYIAIRVLLIQIAVVKENTLSKSTPKSERQGDLTLIKHTEKCEARGTHVNKAPQREQPTTSSSLFLSSAKQGSPNESLVLTGLWGFGVIGLLKIEEVHKHKEAILQEKIRSLTPVQEIASEVFL